MKRAFSSIFLMLAAAVSLSAYTDHRDRNVDSLERVAAPWTQEMIESAREDELVSLVRTWDGLMNGYLQTNAYRSRHYAQKILDVAVPRGWDFSIYAACKVIGQHFWAREAYDSAAVYYGRALEAVDRMAAGSRSPSAPDGYDSDSIDDAYSAMYGTLGNLYCIMDSIPAALRYYGMAEDIFRRHGWTTSLAVLHHNMGELYMDSDDLKSARQHYEKALAYGREAGDSLWIASPLMGLGGLYVRQGRYHKAVGCLLEADSYFSRNQDQEADARLDTLDFLNAAYRAQKREALFFIAGLAVLLMLLMSYIAVLQILRRTRREMAETGKMLDETIEELRPVRKDEGESAPAGAGMESLTVRERQVLELVAAGRTNPQIAETLGLSPETIKWYRKKLLAKLGASNTAELVKICVEQNISSKHE